MQRKSRSIAVGGVAPSAASAVASEYAAPTLEELGRVEDYTASIGISIIVGGGGHTVTVNGVQDPAQVLGNGASVNSTSTPVVTLPVTT